LGPLRAFLIPGTPEPQRTSNSARQGVVFAESEVERARKHCLAIEAHYAQQLDAAQSWLRETERRLRCALMVARRSAPDSSCQAVDPAPWLPPTAAPLLDWKSRITIDENRLREDD
jgi:hypothetical protein